MGECKQTEQLTKYYTYRQNLSITWWWVLKLSDDGKWSCQIEISGEMINIEIFTYIDRAVPLPEDE